MNDYLKRQGYLTESRDNAARFRIARRSLTRRERIYRKKRIELFLSIVVLLLWAALVAFALFSGNAAEPEPIAEAPVVKTIEEGAEAVLNEFDPVREDIPLDAETQRLLYAATEETGIRYEVALAVIWQETDFRNVIGDDGDSIGYMQVQPKWHGTRMERLGVTDLADPYSNFLVGCDFLAELFAKYDLTEALTAYNSGKPGDSKYANSVLNYINILTEEI